MAHSTMREAVVIRWLAAIPGIFCTSVVWAALAVSGSEVTTESASAASHSVNIPDPCAANALIVVGVSVDEPNRFVTSTGYTRVGMEGDVLGVRIGWLYKVSGGSEGSSITVDLNTGTSAINTIAICITGVDTGDPTNSDNSVEGGESAEDPVVIAAGQITGMSTSSWNLLLFGEESQARTIVGLDSDLTLIAETTVQGYLNLAYETGVTSNSEYSNDMSSSGDQQWAMLEIVEASGSQSPVPIILQQHY